MSIKKALPILILGILLATSVVPVNAAVNSVQSGDPAGQPSSANVSGALLNTPFKSLYELFDAEYYARLYPDAAAVYGTSKDALYKHFIRFGIKEGRSISTVFDVNAYKSAYPDLAAAFGNDILKYYEHYITHGQKENRTLVTAKACLSKGITVSNFNGKILHAPTPPSAVNAPTGSKASNSGSNNSNNGNDNGSDNNNGGSDSNGGSGSNGGSDSNDCKHNWVFMNPTYQDSNWCNGFTFCYCNRCGYGSNDINTLHLDEDKDGICDRCAHEFHSPDDYKHKWVISDSDEEPFSWCYCELCNYNYDKSMLVGHSDNDNDGFCDRCANIFREEKNCEHPDWGIRKVDNGDGDGGYHTYCYCKVCRTTRMHTDEDDDELCDYCNSSLPRDCPHRWVFGGSDGVVYSCYCFICGIGGTHVNDGSCRCHHILPTDEDTAPVEQSAIAEDTAPIEQSAIAEDTAPVEQSVIAEDTVPVEQGIIDTP